MKALQNLSLQSKTVWPGSNLIMMPPLFIWKKSLLLVAGLLASVDDIVLEDEDAVKNQAAVAKRQLHRVARDAAPVVLQVAMDAELGQAQDSSDDIEDDLPDAPTTRALVAVVCEDLGRVLDQRDQELDIADGVGDIQLAPVGGRVPRRRRTHDEASDEEAQRRASNDAGDEAAGAGTGAGLEAPKRAEEILRGGDDAEDEGMQRKCDVVEGDGGEQAVMAGGVLAPHDGGVIQGDVGSEIRGETWGAQGGRGG